MNSAALYMLFASLNGREGAAGHVNAFLKACAFKDLGGRRAARARATNHRDLAFIFFGQLAGANLGEGKELGALDPDLDELIFFAHVDQPQVVSFAALGKLLIRQLFHGLSPRSPGSFNVAVQGSGAQVDLAALKPQRIFGNHHTRQIVSAGLLNLHLDKLARHRHVAAVIEGEVDHAVNIGGLAVVTALQNQLVLFADAVDDHLGGLTHPLGVLAFADALLKLHDGVAALDLDVLLDLVLHHARRGALFGAVDEDADPVELHLFDPVMKFLKLRVGFPRVARDEACAQHQIFDAAQLIDETGLRVALDVALHGLEDAPVNVLQGHIHIGHELVR